MFGWLGGAGKPEEGDARDAGVGRTGLVGSVHVAGPEGWRPISEIEPGDPVLTFDAGLQRVETIFREPAWPGQGPCPHALWPVEFPPGCLGNRDLMHLAADQLILVESDEAEALTGDPFALLSAQSLVGLPGMHHAPPGPDALLVTLGFETEQIIFAGGGAMLYCPGTAPDLLDVMPAARRYPRLGPDDARRVAAQLGPPGAQARSAGLPGIRS